MLYSRNPMATVGVKELRVIPLEVSSPVYCGKLERFVPVQ